MTAAAPAVRGAVEIRDLSYAYGGITALRHVNAEIKPGEVCCILGPNGAGKSTLGATLAGALTVPPGTVLLDGVDQSRQPLYRRAQNGVAYIPEGGAVFPSLTVTENLCLDRGRASRRERSAIVEQAAGYFKFLGDRRATRAGMLSGGEQQMLSLARILINAPAVAVIDELSHGLAPAIVQQLFTTLGAAKGRTTFVLIEQYLERAFGLADLLLVLSRGTPVYRGTAADTSIAELEELYQRDHD